MEENKPDLLIIYTTKNGRTDIRDIISITTNTSELQHFWGEYGFPHGSLYGECSLLSSFGAMFPTKTKEFFDYGVTGQIGKLFRMQAEYLAVSDAFQEPAVGPDRIDGAYDKMIQRAGGNPGVAITEVDNALAKVPAVSGGGAQQTPGLDNDAVRALDSAEQLAEKAGDSFVTVERLLLALTLATTTAAGKALAAAGGKAEALNAAITYS